MIVPVYLPYYVLAGSAAMTAAILAVVRQALARADWPTPGRDRLTRGSTIVLTGWLGAAIALGLLGVYQAAPDRLPTIQFGILVPLLIGGLLLWRSATVGRLLEAVPQSWLVGVQGYRALGAIFLILYGTGKLPGLFAFTQPNELISAFPLVLVPTYLVPASVLLHLASLAKLRRAALRADAQHSLTTISKE